MQTDFNGFMPLFTGKTAENRYSFKSPYEAHF